MRIALLGPVELSHDGRRIRLNGSKQLALLALLALNAARLLSADHIVDALWGDDEAGDAINALQHQISRLRAAIGREQVSFHGSGYSLQIPADAVDVRRFEPTLLRKGVLGYGWGQPSGRDHPALGSQSVAWAAAGRAPQLPVGTGRVCPAGESSAGCDRGPAGGGACPRTSCRASPRTGSPGRQPSLPGTTLGSPHAGALSVRQAGRRLGVLSGSCSGSRERSWVGPGSGVAPNFKPRSWRMIRRWPPGTAEQPWRPSPRRHRVRQAACQRRSRAACRRGQRA